MSCDISEGRKEECKDNVGGIKAIYFINYLASLLADASLTDEVITTLGTATQTYKFELKGTNGYDEENGNSRESGTSFYTQTGTVVLKKQNAVTQKNLKLASYGRPQVIIEDYNGNFRLAGAEHGCEVVVNTSTGTGMGELNGYNLTFTGIERSPAHYIDASLMDNVAGFVVNEGTN